MKPFNLILNFILAFVFASLITPCTGVDPMPLAAGITTTHAVVTLVQPDLMHGKLLMALQTEVWTGELIKKLRQVPTFLSVIRSRNNLVNNNTIHLVDVGASPNILINNSAYPIATAGRTDEDIAISLKKFETENTKVTDDELYALSYDKIATVLEDHKDTIAEGEADVALHAIAPVANGDKTPVVDISTLSGDRPKVVLGVLALKRAFDDQKIPQMNRHLVLTSEHIEAILAADEKFSAQYSNVREGQVLKLFGFQLHEWGQAPQYVDVNTKIAYGAETEGKAASVAFHAPHIFQATGDTKMYYRDAKVNPEYRESVVGFRQWHICLPKTAARVGAMADFS